VWIVRRSQLSAQWSRHQQSWWKTEDNWDTSAHVSLERTLERRDSHADAISSAEALLGTGLENVGRDMLIGWSSLVVIVDIVYVSPEEEIKMEYEERMRIEGKGR
jgi:hypothetical protein